MGHGRSRMLVRSARPDDTLFGPWHDLMRYGASDFAKQAKIMLEKWKAQPLGTAQGQVNPLVREALLHAKLTSKADVARAYGNLLQSIYAESKKPSIVSDAAQPLLELVTGRESPSYFTKGQSYYYMSRQEKDAYGGMKMAMDKLAVKSPVAPPRAMVLYDAPEMHDPYVFVRGNS